MSVNGDVTPGYDGKMRTVATAAAVGLATGIFGGVFGYFLARLLLERGIVGGPPAGVLLFILPPFLAAGCAFVGFVLALLRLWMAARKSTSLDECNRDFSTTIGSRAAAP